MKASEKLKILKQTLKKKNKDFAKELGLALTSVANISSGKYGFTEAMAKKFHQAYNVSPPWLLFSIGSMFSNPNDQEEQYINTLRNLDERDKNIVYGLLNLMAKKENTPSQAMEPIEQDFSDISILGTIAAGDPILELSTTVEESSETILAHISPKKKNSFYALRVKGNSMIEHRIHDGDIVVINKDAHPSDRCIAVCLIDNQAATLKQVLIHSENNIELKPFNKDMESIFLNSKSDLKIQGVLHQTIIQN